VEDDKNDDDSGSGPHGHLYNFSDDSGLAGLKSKTDQDMGIMFGRNGSSVVSGTDRFYGIVYRGGVIFVILHHNKSRPPDALPLLILRPAHKP
jgi:hypothetical protein